MIDISIVNLKAGVNMLKLMPGFTNTTDVSDVSIATIKKAFGYNLSNQQGASIPIILGVKSYKVDSDIADQDIDNLDELIDALEHLRDNAELEIWFQSTSQGLERNQGLRHLAIKLHKLGLKGRVLVRVVHCYDCEGIAHGEVYDEGYAIVAIPEEVWSMTHVDVENNIDGENSYVMISQGRAKDIHIFLSYSELNGVIDTFTGWEVTNIKWPATGDDAFFVGSPPYKRVSEVHRSEINQILERMAESAFDQVGNHDE